MPHYRFDAQEFEQTVAHGGQGAVLARRVLARENDSAINFIDLVDVPPDASVGLHRHGAHDQEVYIIIQGTGRMIIDGVERRVGPGDVLLNMPGGQHSLINDGTMPIRMVVVDVALNGQPYVEPQNIG